MVSTRVPLILYTLSDCPLIEIFSLGLYVVRLYALFRDLCTKRFANGLTHLKYGKI